MWSSVKARVSEEMAVTPGGQDREQVLERKAKVQDAERTSLSPWGGRGTGVVCDTITCVFFKEKKMRHRATNGYGCTWLPLEGIIATRLHLFNLCSTGTSQVAQWWRIGRQCRRCRSHRFNPWGGKTTWRRKWQLTPVFLPVKSHGQRSLAGYSPWGRKQYGPQWWGFTELHLVII